MFLAGDAGGTKTRLALYQMVNGKLTQSCVEQFPSQGAPSLGHIINQFLANKPHKPTHACIGIPGPVINGFVKTPNLPWEIYDTKLAQEIGVTKIQLVNDLVATTAAVPHLSNDSLITLHPGEAERDKSVCAVLAPGTGTGQGFITSRGGRTEAWPSEGGHVDFTPTNETEDKLLVYLRKKIGGRVSAERVLCGPGFVNIYEFLRDTGMDKEPKEIVERCKAGNPGAVIAQSALNKEFSICVKALDIFTYALGAHAGNLVLTYMATGGMYLGGGVPPKIAEKLKDGKILEGYLNKGRLVRVVRATPLYIIKDDHAAILGAASIASAL